MGIGPIWGINSLTPSFSLDFSLCSGWLEVCPDSVARNNDARTLF